jgi:hypothetical protein
MTKTEISVDKAKEALWEQGVLDWKLSEPQRIIKKGILEDFNKVSVVLCSRRLGKTYLLCTLAIETCLRKPFAVVKYAFPKQNMAKKNLFPVMRKILDDCPTHLKPQYISSEKVFRFPNGSEIQISGTDNGGFDNLRGGDADFCAVDEAGFCDDLTYGIRSVLGPTVKLTKGRIVMVSTPSRSESHEFIQDWVLKYMIEDRIRVYTIYDNPQFNAEAIKEAEEEYPDGVKDPMFRREYLCEIIRDAGKTILPSFNNENERIIVTDQFEMPVFCDKYVSMDIGGSDLTAVLFGFYDYLNATLVIQDEFICDGTTNTEILAENIRRIEAELWTNPIDRSVLQPYLRVSDNNNKILLTDLQKLHGLTFTTSKKDKREAAINALDVAIGQHKLIIHPKCKTLLYHLKFAEWNNARTDFKRLKDSPTGKIRGGHADGLPALLYMHRSVVKSHNPYPQNYGHVHDSNVFKSLLKPSSDTSNVGEIFKHLFKKNK